MNKMHTTSETYYNGNDNADKPTLENNHKILSEITDDPSDHPEHQDDPIKNQFG